EIPLNEDSVEGDGSAAHLGNVDEDLAAGSDEGASNFARQKRPLLLSSGQALLSQLLIHDAAQREKAFSSQQFDCGVCFTSWLGAECVQLIDCGHVFCRTCLAEFCKVQITNGSVREVTCLHAGCKAAPTPAQVRSLVGDELFGRYDRLLLQFSLDSMPDVMYCPRPSCASAVITDSSSSMALCTVCSFAFCVHCKKTYHSTETLDQEALWEDYSSGNRARRKLLEHRYGKGIMLGFLTSCLSEDWITINSKTCPHCFNHIEKNGGCDHMTCSQCNHQFCWICVCKWPCACVSVLQY
uniref:RBR-type E3 ubiquitin transferase n=1 Tax=Neogobius melanostomus TaxID=47308 RepID=A0A8C6URX9_9GOBI